MKRHAKISLGLCLGLALAVTGCKKEEAPTPDASVDLGKTDVGKHDGVVVKVDGKPKTDGPQAKKPKITQILPSSGFGDGTTLVTLIGEGFAAGMSAYLDGQPLGTAVNVASSASASLTMPRNPYGPPYTKPAKVTVLVMVGSTSSNAVDFWYTVVAPMEAGFKGTVVTAKSDCYRDFPSDPIQGKVSLTIGADAGAAPTVKAELGYGKAGSDPTNDSTWKWSAATFKQKDGAYDVFEGTLTVPLAQTYDVAYRFSKDGGGTWIYADTDETNLAYETAKSAKLTATNPPPGFCMSNQDCVVNKYTVTCKVNAADKTKNTCVECLANADCTGYAKALGPTCAKELCGCAADPDCSLGGKPNANGAKCLQGYCGCTGDTNCVAPAKCYQDQNTGMTTCN